MKKAVMKTQSFEPKKQRSRVVPKKDNDENAYKAMKIVEVDQKPFEDVKKASEMTVEKAVEMTVEKPVEKKQRKPRAKKEKSKPNLWAQSAKEFYEMQKAKNPEIQFSQILSMPELKKYYNEQKAKA